MSAIKIHPDEFADIVTAYLLDMLRDEANLPDNDDFKSLVKSLKEKGVKTPVYHNFISMNGMTRIKYKRVKKALLGEGEGETRIIVTTGDTQYINEDTFDRELCKKIFRTIKEVRMKHPSKILREDRLDKIIDYCVQQKKNQQEEHNG